MNRCSIPKSSDTVARVLGPTFADLKSTRKQALVEKPRTWRNALTGLNRYMDANSLADASPLSPSMTVEFEERREVLLATLRDKSDKYRGDLRYVLNAWHRAAQELCFADGLPSEFCAALTEAMRCAGVGKERLAVVTGIPVSTIEYWRSGRSLPSLNGPVWSKNVERVGAVEVELGLPPGTLRSRIVTRVPGSYAERAERSGKARRAVSLRQIAFRIPFIGSVNPFPPHLEKVVQRLAHFKTASVPGLAENGKSLRRSAKGRWRTRNGEVPTEGEFRKIFGNFVAWLCLPDTAEGVREFLRGKVEKWGLTNEEVERLVPYFTGRGFQIDEVDFLHFTDPVLLGAYSDWRTLRTGSISSWQRDVFGKALSLLRPEYGFVWQNVDLAWTYMNWPRIAAPRTPAEHARYDARANEWKAICTERYLQIGDIRGGIPNLGRKARNPRVSLRPILDLDDPMGALVRVVDRHRDSRPVGTARSNDVAIAVWARDQVILELLLSNLLRNRNCREATWMPNDSSSNIYRKGDEWRIRFDPEDFKNEAGAASEGYDAPIRREAWPILEEYISVHRDVLLGDQKRNELFITRNGSPLTAYSFSHRIYVLTLTFFDPDLCFDGIRSHAWRHIAATSWLRHHPEDVVTVALMLHDTVETVMRNYAHLTNSDGIRRFHSWLSGRRA